MSNNEIKNIYANTSESSNLSIVNNTEDKDSTGEYSLYERVCV